MSKKEMTSQEQLNELLNLYYGDSPPVSTDKELELRYGLGENYITKRQFNNVMNKLKSSGFILLNKEGDYILRINPMTRGRSGFVNQSYVRAEINELNNIQTYCKTDYFDPMNIPDHINLIQKMRAIKDKKADPRNPGRVINEFAKPVDFYNSNFRVNYKLEKKLSEEDKKLQSVLKEWPTSKKIYRYLKRYRFKIPNMPFEIHCSIVKTSKQKKSRGRSIYIPESNIEASNVFNNPENYEIELEFIDDEISNMVRKKASADGYKESQPTIFNKMVMNIIKKYTKIILSGIQSSNYPIRYNEQTDVLKEYLKLSYINKYVTNVKDNKRKPMATLEQLLKGDSNYKRKNRMNFIGPSTVSLEMKHIVQTENKNNPNINNLYTVTEKADGERHLLYVNSSGKIYLLDINLNVKFTGCVIDNEKVFDTILDGELVSFNKKGDFINHFLIFDLYVVRGKDYRQYPFMSTTHIKHEMKYGSPDIDKNKFRYIEMRKLAMLLQEDSKNIVYGKTVPMIFKSKVFENNTQISIFQQCKKILDKVNALDYETDGLIFTPIDKSVGSDKITLNHSAKKTWLYSLKWKPPIHNTIDFLITTKKVGTKDYIGNIYEKGTNTDGGSNIKQYKQLELRVGYSQYQHGFLNPMNSIIHDSVKRVYDPRDLSKYRPVLFYPTNPTPDYAICYCNILLSSEGNKQFMKIENGTDVFENDTIVEFKFDPTKPKNWEWVPIKVRYDKTAAYKKGQRNYGNDYSVANSVWMSINNPITNEMIKSGNNIPDYIDDDEVYYNKQNKTKAYTRTPFKDFHNKYVKYKLLNHIPKADQNLLDMTVGKAGDLPKWIQARFNSVVGIDYSVDNIENSLDGACARYLKEKQRKASIPKCMFLSGDSSKNIKNGAAFGDKQKNKNIMNAIYGNGNRDPKEIGEGVAKIFGIGEKGFDIISNQFSTHYFFKNKESIIEFVTNLTENCKVGGYIMGTCYDGNKIFNLLKDKQPNDAVVKKDNKGNITWRIIKKYQGSELKNDETSLGLEIDILQDSINKVHTEYLVVFEYFSKILESFGFIPCPEEELGRFGLKKHIGSFKELFELMENDVKENKFPKKNLGKALDMSESEKFVSFLNNYYVFKKQRKVNTQTVRNSLYGIDNAITSYEKKQHQSIVDSSLQQQRDFVIKYRRKIELK
jgi:hypothetical protein